MVDFGWSYPAGVTSNDIDEHFGEPEREEVYIVVLYNTLPRKISEMFVGLTLHTSCSQYDVYSADLLEPLGDKELDILDRLYKSHKLIHWTLKDQRGRLHYAHEYNQ